MKEKMKSLISNQTWKLAKLPVGKKALHYKWMYGVKEEHDGFKRYKVRLVIKGFNGKKELTTQISSLLLWNCLLFG